MIKVLEQKRRKRRKRRGSDSEGSGSYDEDYDDDYDSSEEDYFSGSGSGSYESGEEEEMDLDDLTVDDLEHALVVKLKSEIGDDKNAEEVVSQMLKNIKQDLLGDQPPSDPKTSQPGMPEDFYDWAKAAAIKAITKGSQKNLGGSPSKEKKKVSSPVKNKDTFFDWKKHAKDRPKHTTEAAPPPPAPASEGAPLHKTSTVRAYELKPYDFSLVERWTLRPSTEDPEIRVFNWKGFTKDRRILPESTGVAESTGVDGGAPGVALGGASFDWKKYAKQQRKLARKNVKGGSAEKGIMAGFVEEKKSDEPPHAVDGVELLKMLMRSKGDEARASLLDQYIPPSSSTEATLGHVAPDDLLKAIAQFVSAVRTLKQSDNCPEITLAKQVAIVARLSIIKHYGEESEILQLFQQGLGPVFAPAAPAAEADAASVESAE